MIALYIDRVALVEDNLALVRHVHRQLSATNRRVATMDRDDVLSYGQEALFRAAERYSPHLGAFPTLAKRAIEDALRAAVRRKRIRTEQLSQRLPAPEPSPEEDLEQSDLLTRALSAVNAEDRQLVHDRVCEGRTWHALNGGKNTVRIRNRLAKALRQMRRHLDVDSP